jgi:anti-sigma factor RsiW
MASLSDKDREDLSAFLDGELDAKRASNLEAMITVDPQIRAEAEALRRTWDLLEYLPRPEPSVSFTNRTLEKLAVRQTQAVPAASAGRRWALGLGWAAAVVLAAIGGFALAGWLWRSPELSAPAADVRAEPPNLDEELTRHLRIIRNLRQYELVDDLEMLQALDSPELFSDDRDS